NNLGVALSRKGQKDEAIVCYKKAIDLDPKFALAHLNLGIVLAAQGKLNEAIVCYRAAVRLQPQRAAAHGKLGVALYRVGDWKGAVAALEKSIDLGKGTASVFDIFRLAIASWHTGHKREAREYYNR